MTNIPVSERSKWLGASESAALFDLSPYTTRFALWHEKMGTVPTADLSSDERVNAGKYLEPSIAEWAANKWGWPLLNIKEYRSIPELRMGASLDFATVEGDEPVEIKNVDNLVFRDDWETEDDEIVDAPLHILIQLQHQLACSPGPQAGWIVACVGGNRLYRMRVDRHEKMIQRLKQEAQAFWQSILNQESPKPNFDLDAETIALLYSGAGAEVIDLRGSEQAAELGASYLACLEVEKDAKKRKSACLAELKVMMQDARGAILDDGIKISASHIKEQSVYRAAHWRFSVRQKKEIFDGID